MKLLTCILALLPFFAFAQAKPTPISSTIKEVTIFINGGQVNREAATHLPQGKTKLVVKGLTKYLDPKSIKVKGLGDFTILSIHNQLDYLDKKPAKVGDSLRNEIESLELQIEVKNIELQSLNERIGFLRENKKVTGTNTPVSFSDYDGYYKLYGKEMKKLLLAKNDLNIEKQKLLANQIELMNQLNEMADKARKGFYKVFIIVQADRPMPAKFEISYYVSNCGWFPSYDLRVEDIHSPINLSYKANLRQTTGVDWENVLLTFSNATPTDAGNAPELYPFYLGEDHVYTRYSKFKRVTGVVQDGIGEPLIGASVLISGTTIGTTTDIDGRYSLTVPSGSHSLEVSYVGFSSLLAPITSGRMDLTLEEQGVQLSEVIITGGEKKLLGRIRGKIAGVSSNAMRSIRSAKIESQPVETNLITNTTSLEFKIKVPYTILSKPKAQTIEMANYDMPATYEYKIVPKIEKAAYLLAYVTDWEQFHLMDGESNLYFENTYVGKALIESSSLNDTLALSLGKDKSIAITRTSIKEKSSRRFIGGKKIIQKAWNIEIKNNKSIPIKISVMDQIPVSRKGKIEVYDIEYGSASYDKITGEVQWKSNIAAHGKEEYQMEYTVKHPKNWSVKVE